MDRVSDTKDNSILLLHCQRTLYSLAAIVYTLLYQNKVVHLLALCEYALAKHCCENQSHSRNLNTLAHDGDFTSAPGAEYYAISWQKSSKSSVTRHSCRDCHFRT